MDSEELNSAGTAQEPGLAGPGASLRAAREALRLDLAHIAAETRIPLRHLEAIEAGNFENLPSRAYAIGFSRTFAKAVGLDEVAMTEAVRAELADGSMRRTVPSQAMEPGDPARLPSAGLAWAMGGAVLIFAIGAFAFYNSYFGAGSVPGSLISPTPDATAPAPATTLAAAAPAAVPSGPVVLTALEDGIWVRLYEEGGERLTERRLKQGETVEVPVAARDPRINTGRPDALAVTIGGQSVAKLSDRPETISDMPVSAAALVARAAAPAVANTASPLAGETSAPPRTVRRRVAPRPSAAETVPTGEPTSEVPDSEAAQAIDASQAPGR
ncbi:MAG: helix-turn-helix domain-containing protein [Sphingomonadales bacterium]|nr:MAG: helix-turn-helix domain-containing protein [Sphingomonadales bacterium]